MKIIKKIMIITINNLMISKWSKKKKKKAMINYKMNNKMIL